MLNAPVRTVFDVITDFLVTNPPLDELLQYQLPDDLQARVEFLLEKNGEDQLTFDEQRELMDFIRAEEMIEMLKIKTQLALQDSDA